MICSSPYSLWVILYLLKSSTIVLFPHSVKSPFRLLLPDDQALQSNIHILNSLSVTFASSQIGSNSCWHGRGQQSTIKGERTRSELQLQFNCIAFALQLNAKKKHAKIETRKSTPRITRTILPSCGLNRNVISSIIKYHHNKRKHANLGFVKR